MSKKNHSAPRTVLVTGGNRGIGLEVCRQLGERGMRVILTARSEKSGRAAAKKLGVEFRVLDVTNARQIKECARRLRRAGEMIDVLINNAGTYAGGEALEVTAKAIRGTFDVNFFGALWTCQAFVPGMVERGYGRVVNVSSGYGSLDDGLEGPAAYSLSKAALNALTLRLSREVGQAVKVNAACPGWVRTRMGGANAERSVEEGADTIVWLATLPGRGPSGGFFRDRERIPW